MYGLISDSVLFYFDLFEKSEVFFYMLGLQQILYMVVLFTWKTQPSSWPAFP